MKKKSHTKMKVPTCKQEKIRHELCLEWTLDPHIYSFHLVRFQSLLDQQRHSPEADCGVEEGFCLQTQQRPRGSHRFSSLWSSILAHWLNCSQKGISSMQWWGPYRHSVPSQLPKQKQINDSIVINTSHT